MIYSVEDWFRVVVVVDWGFSYVLFECCIRFCSLVFRVDGRFVGEGFLFRGDSFAVCRGRTSTKSIMKTIPGTFLTRRMSADEEYEAAAGASDDNKRPASGGHPGHGDPAFFIQTLYGLTLRAARTTWGLWDTSSFYFRVVYR